MPSCFIFYPSIAIVLFKELRRVVLVEKLFNALIPSSPLLLSLQNATCDSPSFFFPLGGYAKNFCPKASG